MIFFLNMSDLDNVHRLVFKPVFKYLVNIIINIKVQLPFSYYKVLPNTV